MLFLLDDPISLFGSKNLVLYLFFTSRLASPYLSRRSFSSRPFFKTPAVTSVNLWPKARSSITMEST